MPNSTISLWYELWRGCQQPEHNLAGLKLWNSERECLPPRQLALHQLPWKDSALFPYPTPYTHVPLTMLLWDWEFGAIPSWLILETEPSRPWSLGDLWEQNQTQQPAQDSILKMHNQATSAPRASQKPSVSTQVKAIGKYRNKNQDPQIPSLTFNV